LLLSNKQQLKLIFPEQGKMISFWFLLRQQLLAF